jgi:Fe-coproporphyrin III synthase
MTGRELSIAASAISGSFWRVNLSVTNRCNSRCVMCNVWKTPTKDELSADQYRPFFKGLDKKLRWLHITGGEPFLRADLREIISDAAELCPRLSVVDFATNGFLTETVSSSLEEMVNGNRKIMFAAGISIDGRPPMHEHIRNVDGCFDRAAETYKNLLALSQNRENFQAHVNFTVSPWNLGEITAFCQEYPFMSPVSISFYHQGQSFKNATESKPEADFATAAEADVRWFLAHGRETSFVKKLFLQLSLQYLEEPSKKVLPCEACVSSCFVDPKGDVYPCTLLNTRLGSILEDPQLGFLKSASTKELRRKINNGLCNCWSGCECWSSILRHMPSAVAKAYLPRKKTKGAS